MNKNLFLAIILVSMIPGLFAIGRGISSISGNLMADAQFVSDASLIVMYFVAAAIVLGFALIFLIKSHVHSDEEKSKTIHVKTHSIVSKIHHSKHARFHIHSNIANNVTISPEKLILAVVALVGVVAIVIILG